MKCKKLKKIQNTEKEEKLITDFFYNAKQIIYNRNTESAKKYRRRKDNKHRKSVNEKLQ